MRKETERSSGSCGKGARRSRSNRGDGGRRRLAKALEQRTVLRRSEEAPDYEAALERAGRCLQSLQTLHANEYAEAKDLVAEIVAHPPERQKLILQNHSRFQTWSVCALLLDQSRAQSLLSSASSEHLARLALLVANFLESSRDQAGSIEDLRARAWTYIGNACRQRSDLAGAEDAFQTAAACLQRGTGDPIELGMFLDLRASLLRAQRRFPRAMSLLKRAYTIFLAAGDRHRAGRALVSLEIVHHHAGTPEHGIPLLHRALELIDPQQEPRLILCVWHNLVDDLAESGRAMEARRLFLKARSLYPRFPEAVTQNRRTWVAGKIARGLGQDREAEELLLEARRSFLAEDVPYEVALVSLDLAAIYAQQGRTDELQRLATEMMPVFSSRQIHREALAALLYWKQAVEAETGRERIAELVASVAAFLKRARYDSELRFTAPA